MEQAAPETAPGRGHGPHVRELPQHFLANHGKPWDAKPEAGGRTFRSMLVRLQPANQWKRWDAKPEAAAPGSCLRSASHAMLDRLPDPLHPN